MAENQRWNFFKEGDSSFGLFYPKNYTLAGFTGQEQAEAAARELRAARCPDDDVRVVSGSFVVDYLESQADAGWLERVKAAIAEFIGTETYFIDQDIALARRGGSFLFVYTPDDQSSERVETVLIRHPVVHARRYLPLAIERLVDPR
jgi:hypothetical protein